MDDLKLADDPKITSDQSEAEAIRLMDYPDSVEEIPILDMAPYLAGETGGREKVAARLGEITETVGFFYLTGHGISQSLIDGVFDATRQVHSLPIAVKRGIPCIDNATFKSGYQGIVEEPRTAHVNIISDAKPNLYSRFSINREGGSSGEGILPRGPVNVWPENLPGFRETVLEYHDRVEALGQQFLPLWATCLGLPLDYFEKFFKTPHALLSLLHYPPQKVVGNRQYGIAPHTDNSLMTFLAQANVPGLAVRMPSGHWRIVDIKPGTLLVNTGNLMVRWTNGKYLSTKHRVINTSGVERYSIPLFFGPSGDALIEVLPTCQGPGNPAREPPITYEALRRWYYGYED